MDEYISDDRLTEIMYAAARWAKVPVQHDEGMFYYSRGVIRRAFHNFRGKYPYFARMIVQGDTDNVKFNVDRKNFQNIEYLRIGEALIHWLAWQPALARSALLKDAEPVYLMERRSYKILGELYGCTIPEFVKRVTGVMIKSHAALDEIESLKHMKGSQNLHMEFYKKLDAREEELTHQLISDIYRSNDRAHTMARPFLYIEQNPRQFVTFMRNVAVDVLQVDMHDVWG